MVSRSAVGQVVKIVIWKNDEGGSEEWLTQINGERMHEKGSSIKMTFTFNFTEGNKLLLIVPVKSPRITSRLDYQRSWRSLSLQAAIAFSRLQLKVSYSIVLNRAQFIDYLTSKGLRICTLLQIPCRSCSPYTGR
jgi:hypothetical protein